MRTPAFVFIAALTFAPADALAQAVKTRYFLPKSVLTVSGTVTTKCTFPQDSTQGMVARGSVETSQVTVTLATAADPAMPLVLLSERALLSKNTVSVELTSGGVLAAVNAKSEGMLGSIVKNVFGAAVVLSKMAGGLLMTSMSDAERKYLNEHAPEANRRTQLKTAIQSATSTLIDAETRAIAEEHEPARKVLKDRISDLKASLVTLRAELLLADAHYAAWKSRMEDARERRFEHVFDVDDLPEEGPVKALAASTEAIDFEDVMKAAGNFAAITKDTRLIITQAGARAQTTPVKADTESTAITYRAVRPVVLSVYLLDSSGKPVLSKQSLEFVVGVASPTMSIAVHNAKWSTKSIGLGFTAGVLTKVSTESGSELAGAAESFRGLPAEYLGALKQANEIVTEQNKLGLSGLQGQIDELRKQKELAEARVASGESGDLAAMQAETARLDAELKLLTSQRALAGSRTSGADTTSLALQVQVMKLQNDLAEAQLKQIQLQQQLDELRRKRGGVQ